LQKIVLLIRHFIFPILFLSACGLEPAVPSVVRDLQSPESVSDSPTVSPQQTIAHPGFTEVTQLDPSIKLDIRYATTDNFTKSKIYDCPNCLLRPEAAEAVVKAHKSLKKKGLGLKMFDCYRPRPYQQRLWDKVPNPDYVTPPSKGSMHSRGAAVDLTIIDSKGKELDMGTPYDFFGPEAHTDNVKLPKKVLENRKILRDALAEVGFKGIRTEWWHFSFQGKSWPLSDYVWPCK
jgi:D-alanyl-D-alanine dipeptidase